MTIILLALTVFPAITNQLSTRKSEVSDASKQLIYQAAELYYKDNSINYPFTAGSYYCVSIDDLVNAGRLSNPVIDLSTGKKISLDKYVKVTVNSYGDGVYDLVDKSSC